MYKYLNVKINIILVVYLTVCMSFLNAQSFVIEQVPGNDDLDATTSAGRGLSLALNNSGAPYFSSYNSEGKLVFVEKVNDSWSFTAITGDIVDGVISDHYETSLAIYENEPVIAYYDGSTGNLVIAIRSNNSWSTSTIDDGSDGGGDTGGYPEIRLLENGELRICYQNIADGKLMIADGNPDDGFTPSVLDASGGTWCSFLNDNEVLYAQESGGDSNIMHATFANNSWSSVDTTMDGVQPVGGYAADGDFEYFASQEKGHYGNNGVADLPVKGYYKANGGSGNFYDDDAGVYPTYVPDVGRAFRTLSYSAIFGNSAAVYANVIKSDGVYRYPINVFGACLEEIRHVRMAKSTGLVHVAFSFFCNDDSKQVIQYATLEVEEPGGDSGSDTSGSSSSGDSSGDTGGSSSGSDDSGGSSGSSDSGGSSGTSDGSGEGSGDTSGDGTGGASDSGGSGDPGDDEEQQAPTLDEIAESIREGLDPGTDSTTEFLDQAATIIGNLKDQHANSKAKKRVASKTVKALKKYQKAYSKSTKKARKQQKKTRKKFLKLINKFIKKLGL